MTTNPEKQKNPIARFKAMQVENNAANKKKGSAATKEYYKKLRLIEKRQQIHEFKSALLPCDIISPNAGWMNFRVFTI